MNDPRYIVIHHSLTPDGSVLDWESIRRYHINFNGWSNIGYHLGVERVGGELMAVIGRPWDQSGAHCKEANMNTRSLGVCVVGNFDLAPPGLATLRYLRDLCFAIMVNYKIPAQYVIGHREAGLMAGFDWRKGQYKSCPGKYFQMDVLREMVGTQIINVA